MPLGVQRSLADFLDGLGDGGETSLPRVRLLATATAEGQAWAKKAEHVLLSQKFDHGNVRVRLVGFLFFPTVTGLSLAGRADWPARSRTR